MYIQEYRIYAEKEIASFEKHAQNMTNKVSELVKQLEAKEQEIARLQSLNFENQRLQQRVTELENALLNASKDSWNNTFKLQSAKVVNKDVENTVALLMTKVEIIENSIKEKDALIVQMQQSSAPDSDSVIFELGEVGETLGWMAPLTSFKFKMQNVKFKIVRNISKTFNYI